jgi:hypothetical protein
MSEELVENSTLSVRARAEIDIQVSTARAYPRNVKDFMKNAEAMVTLSEDIAASCIFALPRKDKGKQIFIKGPSIRLAEIMISCYGHFHAQVRILEIAEKTVTVEGEAWDVQTGNRICLPHVENINGVFSDAKKLAIASATSKALRNVAFRIIPRAYVDELYAIAGKFVIGDQTKLQIKLKELLSKFQLMGIEREKIFTFLGKSSIEELDKEDFLNLVGVGTAIKDGELSIDSAFVLDDTNSDLSGKERVSRLLAMKQGAANGVDTIENQG